MKTLFYTIEYLAVDIDGIKEQTGAKVIRIYGIVADSPLLIAEIESLPESPYTTEEEIQEYLDSNGMDGEYNFTQL